MTWSLMLLKLIKVQKDQKDVSSWTVKILLFDTENNIWSEDDVDAVANTIAGCCHCSITINPRNVQRL